MTVEPIYRTEILRQLDSMADRVRHLRSTAESIEALSGRPLLTLGYGIAGLADDANRMLRNVNFLSDDRALTSMIEERERRSA